MWKIWFKKLSKIGKFSKCGEKSRKSFTDAKITDFNFFTDFYGFL